MKLVEYISAQRTLKLMSLWPPYLFAGISVKSINPECTSVTVQMRQYFFNTNYVGSHFGGSLYSMCDPFYMFLLLEHLSSDHIVWDKAARVEFIKPGKGKVLATFSIDKELIASIKRKCLENFKYEPEFIVDVHDTSGETVARVYKTLYVRRKDAKKRFSKE